MGATGAWHRTAPLARPARPTTGLLTAGLLAPADPRAAAGLLAAAGGLRSAASSPSAGTVGAAGLARHVVLASYVVMAGHAAGGTRATPEQAARFDGAPATDQADR